MFLSYLKLEGNQGLDLSATSDNLNIRSLNNIDINSRKGKVSHCYCKILFFKGNIIFSLFRLSSKPKVCSCPNFLCITPVRSKLTVPEDSTLEAGSVRDILTQFTRCVFVIVDEFSSFCHPAPAWLPRISVNHSQL